MNYTREELRNMEAQLRKVINLASLTTAPLESDVTEVGKKWREESKQTPSQFWGRIAIRCLCAAIEARLFTLRKMAEQIGVVSRVQFTADEKDVLAEQRTVTGTNGMQTVKPKWLPFPDSLKESFRLFAKSVGATVIIDYGVSGFSELSVAFQIRNRLMHPKQPFDVEVTAEDIKTADGKSRCPFLVALSIFGNLRGSSFPGHQRRKFPIRRIDYNCHSITFVGVSSHYD